jgi:O-antigen/teichoic acid export membrane protein
MFGGVSAAVAFQVSKRQGTSGQVVANGLALCSLLGLLPIASLAVSLILLTTQGHWLSFASAGALVGLYVACFTGLFLGESDIPGLNYSQIVTVSVSFTLIALLLLVFHMGVSTAMGIWVTGSLVALIWMWKRSRLKPWGALRCGISWDRVWSLLTFALKIGVTSSIGFLNFRADSFLVEYFGGVSNLGIYSVAVAAAELPWFLSRAVSTACYGRLGREPTDAAASLTAKALRHTTIPLLGLFIAIGVTGPFLLPLVFGTAFRGAVPVLLVLLPGNLCCGLGSVFSAYFTNHLGRPEISLCIAGLSALLDVIGCMVIVPRLGMVGGALASTIAYVIGVVVECVLFMQMTSVRWREMFAFSRADWREQVQWLRTMLSREA